MTWGRDVREPELSMRPAPVEGGLEPELLPGTRESIRAAVAARLAGYVPEWTDRSATDAGMALLRVHGTLGAAVTQRLNRMPRRLALSQLELAGVRARSATSATAVLGVTATDNATVPVSVPAGTMFVTPLGSAGPALETTQVTTALPGTVATVAVFSDGLTVTDTPADLGDLAPFGRTRRPPAQLWWGTATPVAPDGLLSFAVRLAPGPGRQTAEASSLSAAEQLPALRWEALTAAGPAELAVELDDTRGLTRDGVIVLRADTSSPWIPTTLPGRGGDPPLTWVRARLVTGTFPSAARLRSVTLNGVPATARRTIRGEVAEPVERLPSGRSRYRLSQVPVLPGSVDLDIADTAADPFGTAADVSTRWTETASLASADPDERVFTLDPGEGLLTFGDGVAGRAVPAGYRNVVARSYATGGGTTGLPAPGDELSTERSIANLAGATVLSITTGSDAETPAGLLLRGPSTVRSRLRAVAASDYATSALDTPGADVVRAHCLPSRDLRRSGSSAPGTVTVVVVPRATDARTPPTPSPESLAAVARHLASSVGVAGVRVVTASPHYRAVSVTALLIGASDSDPAVVESRTRDRIDTWLSPLLGYDGTGWPFGGTIRWDGLVRDLLTEVASLVAVSRLTFRVDGRRLPACTDVPLQPDQLVWPGGHVLQAIREGGAA